MVVLNRIPTLRRLLVSVGCVSVLVGLLEPRLGAEATLSDLGYFESCTEEELTKYTELSATCDLGLCGTEHEGICDLQSCMDVNTLEFRRKVVSLKPDVGHHELTAASVHLAACRCACAAETCETKFISSTTPTRTFSKPCAAELLSRCEYNDRSLTNACQSLNLLYPTLLESKDVNLCGQCR
eukprot:GHVU01072586.1.p1 GENE.GHVU01072586.1~~GHVU01072586.1.p1  ORF type:complete len:183 (-),score=12.83 GHVU01072586.1:2164-2712(-)